MTTPDDPWTQGPHQQPPEPGSHGQSPYPPRGGSGSWPQPPASSESSSFYGPPGSPQQAWAPQDFQPQQPPRSQFPPGGPPTARPGSGPRGFTYTVIGLSCLVVIAGAGGFIAGRKTAPRATTPTTAPASAAPAASAAAGPAAAPITPAAAHSAATAFFSLYAAGQYAATYPLLAPLARRRIPETTWVIVHQRCRGSVAGLSYKVGKATLAGRSAVMSVSLAGAAATLGSEEVSFVYRDGKWPYAPSDLASYQGTAAHIITRLKAAGTCG
jgi:hypothetical protein